MEEQALSWDSLPDILEVRDTLRAIAVQRARLRELELQISILQARMSKAAPRNAAAKIIGIDEQSEQQLIGLQHNIVQVKNSIDDLEADEKFLNFRKEIVKSVSWKGRT